MNMPDVPKADIIAVAQAALAVAVAFGAPLNPDQQKSLLALATVIAAILVSADVRRRANRAANADKIAAAQAPKVVPRAFAQDTTALAPQPEPSKPAARKKPAPKKP